MLKMLYEMTAATALNPWFWTLVSTGLAVLFGWSWVWALGKWSAAQKKADFLDTLAFELGQIQRYCAYEFPPIEDVARELTAMIFERRRCNTDNFRQWLRTRYATNIAFRPVPFTELAPDIHENYVVAPLPKSDGWQVLHLQNVPGKPKAKSVTVFVAMTPYECNAWLVKLATKAHAIRKRRLARNSK